MKARGNISGISRTLTRQSGKSRTGSARSGAAAHFYGGNPSWSGFFHPTFFLSFLFLAKVKNTLREQIFKAATAEKNLFNFGASFALYCHLKCSLLHTDFTLLYGTTRTNTQFIYRQFPPKNSSLRGSSITGETKLKTN